ncbi:hypothetical protein AB832_01355 [Flavobacteriaceae bacterium (ex Bugula neritina AB1)]|nr:hypothetical protein AB832_01355 [Flavobacteriaceae bacterium (ex Bugula neritina AB1)]
MGIINKEQIKSYFETGDKPKQQEYWDTWDSYWHKDELLPQNKVEQLEETLSEKVDKTVLEEHLSDTSVHGTQVRTVTLYILKENQLISDEELIITEFSKLPENERFIKANEMVIIDANIAISGADSGSF